MLAKVFKKKQSEVVAPVEWRQAGASAAKPPVASAGAAAVDAARIEKEAFERGRQEGEAAGARRALEQLNSVIQGFTETAGSLAAMKGTLRREAEREMVAVSLAVARKVVRRELTLDPSIVLAVVKSCLEELERAEVYKLRLNPQDVEPVGAWFRQQRREGIELIPDASMSRGGAVLESSRGQLDARLETQLLEIERGLADGYG